tara:strand:+ start:1167 stop:1547 length:381 start_codon:yes stop_codon:yes gene_type:complete
MIKNRVDQINRLMGVSIEMHKPFRINNKLQWNIGHYYINQNNGSFGLEQICNNNGGCSDISPRLTKRELYYFCNAYLKGIEDYSYKSNGYLKILQSKVKTYEQDINKRLEEVEVQNFENDLNSVKN